MIGQLSSISRMHTYKFQFSKKYKQYLRFYIQWKTLCFGPRAAPRVSTNFVSVIAALLRSQNIRVAVFLGDWFLVNQSQILSSRSRKMSQSVDFTGVYNKHWKVKCSTHIVFSLSRGQFDLAQGPISPTIETIRKLQLAIQYLMKGQNTPRCFPHLLGIMASCIAMIPNARLYIRQIQRYLICFCRPVSQNLESIIPFTPNLKSTKVQKDHSRF